MSMFSRLFCVFLCFLSFCCGASAEIRQMRKQTDAYFSTVSMLIIYDEADNTAQFNEAWAQVKSILSEIDAAVSLSQLDSDIARFNRLPSGECIPVSTVTAEILTIAFEAHEATGGLYDPTVFPLVDLWGFSPRFNSNTYQPVMPYDRAYDNGMLPLPDPQYIEALLPLIGLSGLSLFEESGQWYLQKNTPSIELDGTLIHAQLDLGGIAKGYACDRVAEYLRSRGYTMGHFVCGGSSMAILSRPTEDGLAPLTLGKPRPGSGSTSHYATVRVRDIGLSTSSDATHAHMRGGIRYCHIIDPRTGWPAGTPCQGVQRGTASITLLAQSAARSDAISTALCLMTPQDAAAYAAAYMTDDYFISALYQSDSDTLEVMTNIPESSLTLDDPAFVKSSFVDESGAAHYTGSFFSP